MSDPVEAWQDRNKAWSFEGDSGLEKLTRLVRDLGYPGHQFKFGDPILHFLSDNPGACNAIVDWISEQAVRNDEWHDALAPDDEEEEDE